MIRTITLLFCACALTVAVTAQVVIKGKVTDTLEHKPAQSASVVILNRSDSTLLAFTRAGRQGEFRIDLDKPGQYILLVTCPRFADFAENLTLEDHSERDMGTISLTQRAQLLEQVIVSGVPAIRIKGDTTEFLADSFAVRDGATVEELLKRLPGFQVDAKGTITTQGQRVDKVLVDGEEFFGDDPTQATQNIGAKAVHKVQVFDQKSDQQQITGLNSGSNSKTINIQLKADKKKGAFGKFYAGSDFTNYYDGKAVINKFQGKKKMSAYLGRTNVGDGSLDWNERGKLGIQDDWEFDEITGAYSMETDYFTDGGQMGLPNATNAGALFINRWNQDRHGFNGSYQYNRLGLDNASSTLTQNILPDSITYSNRDQQTESLYNQNSLNARYEWKPDSLSTIKFAGLARQRISNTADRSTSEYLNSDGSFINNNEQTNRTRSTMKEADGKLSYSLLFKKPRRQLLASVRFSVKDADQDGFLYAKTTFFENGSALRDTATDQQKMIFSHSASLGSKITYSEPIGKKLNLVGSYSFNNNNSSSDHNTFNRSANEKYETPDSLFSSNFDLGAFSHTGMALLKYDTKKMKIGAGSGLAALQLKLNNLTSETVNRYNFLNYMPVAFISLQPKQLMNFQVRYNGTTVQPAIEQLQPLRNNNDPLNIFIGNPDLKVGFRHTVNLDFNSFKVLKSSGWNVHSSYSVHQRAIVNASSIDEKGRRVSTPVNVNGNRNWNVWTSFRSGDGKKKLSSNINVTGNGGKQNLFVNGAKSENRYLTTGLTYGVFYDLPEKMYIYLGPGVNYNSSRSSLQREVDNNYFNFTGNSYLNVKLPKGFSVISELRLDLRQRIAAFDRNRSFVIWNASLEKTVFKNKMGKLILEGNDILDQNRGYNRIINSNFVTEEYFSRISRYFLLKFEWGFNKMPGASK